LARRVDGAFHDDSIEGDAIRHGDHEPLDLLKSEGAIERKARQRRAKVEPLEPLGAGGVMAGLEDRPTQSAPSKSGRTNIARM
jgi:hypothetical protein